MGVTVRYGGEARGPDQREMALAVLGKAADAFGWRTLETLRTQDAALRGYVFEPRAGDDAFRVDFGEGLSFEGAVQTTTDLAHAQILYGLMAMKFLPFVHTRAEDETGLWNTHSMREMHNLAKGRPASHRGWWPF